jgi:hypothetical protein
MPPRRPLPAPEVLPLAFFRPKQKSLGSDGIIKDTVLSSRTNHREDSERETQSEFGRSGKHYSPSSASMAPESPSSWE